MWNNLAVATLVLALSPLAAESPLPGLRVEATSGGTIFYVKNTAPQPLTVYLLELVGYPGSAFAMLQDEVTSEPLPPGAEKKLTTTNMTPGAAPDYMKITAALYADGSSAGAPEKVAELKQHRRVMLETTRDLARRIQKAGTAKAAAIADLKQWAESIPSPVRRTRYKAEGMNQADTRALIESTAVKLDSGNIADVLSGLQSMERALAKETR